MTNCPHPHSEQCHTDTCAIICAACGTVTQTGYRQVDFHPATMTLTTPADIFRIWRELYPDRDIYPPKA